jgi:hypothetical protein
MLCRIGYEVLCKNFKLRSVFSMRPYSQELEANCYLHKFCAEIVSLRLAYDWSNLAVSTLFV